MSKVTQLPRATIGGSRVSESVINVSELTRRFGAKTALASVSLSMPRGAVYGLVGANGAGKTTLIKHILGLLRAESGSVRVFGLDPVADPVAVLSRIGYLSEENDLPGWMGVDELIRYSRAFYPAWDDVYAEELRQAFALDPTARIKNLSKGQRRAGRVMGRFPLDPRSSGLRQDVRRGLDRHTPLFQPAAERPHAGYRRGLLAGRRARPSWSARVACRTPHIARYFLLLVAILAIPLARLSAAPLALAWNRHR